MIALGSVSYFWSGQDGSAGGDGKLRRTPSRHSAAFGRHRYIKLLPLPLSPSDPSTESDVVLTCSNRELDSANRVLFAVAVTVKEESSFSSRRMDPFMGMMGMRHMSMGGVMGMNSDADISAQIQIINNINSGVGLVAFTERAQPENLCALDGKAVFGPNLVGAEDSDLDLLPPYSYGHGFGMGMGMGMGMGFGGMGMGFGMGPMFGFDDDEDDDDDDEDDEEGVVGRIPITKGSVSTFSVDGLPFNSLKELAGRGLVICADVQQDESGQSFCLRPFYACCQLHYDDTPANLEKSQRWSGDLPGRAVDYRVGGPRFESQSGPSQFFIAPLCPPSTKWVAKSLETRRN
ncbi:hypothetical protein PoB_002384700 [Plakobranchus ocellatus]|uniref:Uncharacterized protein n=1 Tax=Plakobranchus ocellatus TaxID=259542 RepID=A0AAV3ZS31_9GAST|nr:hypothetical protein PoB_002384700 [Plakobranchus ocellatus]